MLRWNVLGTSGDEVGYRYAHNCVVLEKEKTMILVGGDKCRNDYFLYGFEKMKWRRKMSHFEDFGFCYSTSCLYHSVRNPTILIFGGEMEYDDEDDDGSGIGSLGNTLFSMEIISSAKERLKKIEPIDEVNMVKPGRRYCHSACITKKNEMFVFGGFSNTEFWLDDLWKYDIAKRKWEEIVHSEGDPWPLERSGHKGVFIPDDEGDGKMLVSCGIDSGINYLNDIWEYDMKEKRWKELKFKNQEKFVGRCHHQMVYLPSSSSIRNRHLKNGCLIIGPPSRGTFDTSTLLSEIREESLCFCVFDLVTMEIRFVKYPNLKMMWEYSMVVFKDEVFIYGGTYYAIPESGSSNMTVKDIKFREYEFGEDLISIPLSDFFTDEFFFSQILRDEEERVGYLKSLFLHDEDEINTDVSISFVKIGHKKKFKTFSWYFL